MSMSVVGSEKEVCQVRNLYDSLDVRYRESRYREVLNILIIEESQRSVI